MNNTRKILLFTFISLFLGSDLLAQSETPYFHIKEINSAILSEEGKPAYSFPLVQLSSQTKVADKINEFLQMNILARSYPIRKERFFDGLYDKGQAKGRLTLGYTVLSNNPCYLSFRFDDETMAFSPDTHTYYMTFNSANGEVIGLSDLLTVEGIAHLNSLSREYFHDQIKDDFLGKGGHLDHQGTIKEYQEQIEYAFDLLKCNSSLKVWKYGLSNNGLILDYDRCLPRIMRVYDIDWNYTIVISHLPKNYFSPLGEDLLVRKRVSETLFSYRKKEGFLFLYGSIDGKYPFTMKLHIDGERVYGYYWYRKFGKPIDLKGKMNAQYQLLLEEDNGRFELNLLGKGGAEGKWFDGKGKSFFIVFK